MKTLNELDLRNTKIICTIGPSSDSVEKLEELIDAGMNIARFNMSHGNHAEQTKKIENLRTAMKNKNKLVGILVDTKGPEIRTHEFENGMVEIVEGSTVKVHMNEILGTATEFSITYGDLINDLNVGDYILVDDGYLRLLVTELDKTNKVIVTKAVNTRTIKSRRGINVPKVNLGMDFISEQDHKDITYASDIDADFLAASFVRTKQDVLDIKKIFAEKGNTHIQIISKIENIQGVDNLNEIIEVSDGIMVARGDLGVEVEASQVPIIQKKIIKECSIAGIMSVTATQMLESMTTNIVATRAEVSDVANAVTDGTSAIMLSGETANGDHPAHVVRTMSKIALDAETMLDHKKMLRRFVTVPSDDRTAKQVATSAAEAMISLDAVAIVCPTNSGYTAKSMARMRANGMIFAVVPNERVARRLTMSWGVRTIINEAFTDFEKLVDFAMDNIVEYKDLLNKKGDRVVVTAGIPLGVTTSRTNTMRIVKFKDKPEWQTKWNN